MSRFDIFHLSTFVFSLFTDVHVNKKNLPEYTVLVCDQQVHGVLVSSLDGHPRVLLVVICT